MTRSIAVPLASFARRLPDIRGKTQLGWRLMRRVPLADRMRDVWDLELVNGDRLSLPSAAEMSWTVAFRGKYDDVHQGLIASSITSGTLVLDVGAALGLWTVPLGRSAAVRGAAVWAFEPHPMNIPWLRRNIELNALSSVVTVRELALGDQEGTVSMVIADHGGGDVGNAAVGEVGGREVPIAVIDRLDLPARVSVIKLDVEGFEIRVLRGAWQTICRDRPVIFGEFNAAWLTSRGEDLRALLRDFRAIGYDVLTAETSRVRPWSASERLSIRRLEIDEVAEDLLLRPVEPRS